MRLPRVRPASPSGAAAPLHRPAPAKSPFTGHPTPPPHVLLFRFEKGSTPVKVYESKDIRNVGVVGHGDSGKTTLTAGLLYTSGATNRLLQVDEGNTITDYDEEEVQRKISITTAIAPAEWKKVKINILDTPGYNIFINDARGALVAADSALVLVDGVSGVEVQTEKVWAFANDFKLPRG